jgi:hypothetical protein
MLGFFAGLRDGEMLATTLDWLWISPDQNRGSITVQETPVQFTNGKRGVWKPKTRQCRWSVVSGRRVAGKFSVFRGRGRGAAGEIVSSDQ